MSAHTHPNIVTDGLVFGFDTGYNVNDKSLGVGRYFKGPISSNILEAQTHSRSNTSGANGFVLNGEEEVNIPQIGIRSVKYVEYYNNYNNTGDLGCCPNLFYYHSGYITGVESSTSYTYSIIYKHTGDYTHPNFMYRYEHQTDGTYNTEGGVHSTARRTHLGNGWYHAWGTFTTQSTTTQLRCYSFLYNYGTTKHRFYVAAISLIKNISGDTHLITPPQLMLKPNTSVSSTQSLIDLKRTTNIDVSNASYDGNAQITFDGTDDYIETSNIYELGSSNFSISVTFKSTGTGWQYFTSNKANFNGPFCRTGLEQTSGKLRFYLEEDNQTNLVVLSQNAYNDGNWYEVVFVRDGSTGYIYVNGELENSGATKSGNVGDSTSNWAIGGGPGDSSGNFIGYISTLKIYNRALTAAEVSQNYNAIKSRFIR